MNKTAIKNFAVSARQSLIKAVSQKAYDIGVFSDRVAPITEVQGGFIYNEQSYTKDELTGRKRLVDIINLRSEGKGYKHGYNQVMEEVAYTWFNRLIALRFMEVNGYLPSNIRILSSGNPERVEPDCIREVENLDFIDMRVVGELSDNSERLYRYILIAQCNALSNIMPRMFEKISDYTELLLPDSMYLREGSIVYDLVHCIEETDFTAQVEIIGWLYQFYISEKKDEVFAGLKKNVKITKENIPAATQLFTPDWIVKYMVENSLGRLAVEKLGIDPVDVGWKYYLPETEQTDEVKAQLAIVNSDKKDFDIKNIKVIDPCMGSGHILVYAFDVLHQIYEKIGYNAREIPNLIIENNLFGLDIDDRAGQLAYFALMMKARSYNRRFFRQDTIPQPKVYAVSDYTTILSGGKIEHIIDPKTKQFVNEFVNGKELGSLLPTMSPNVIDEYGHYFDSITQLETTVKFEELLYALEIKRVLSQKYDVVITNPPYMGGSGMNATLSEYVKKNYPDSKSDLFAVFIEKCCEMLKPNGYQSMITQHAWMFLSSYEKLRVKLLHRDIINMAHLGARAFEEIGGEVVQTTAFVMRSSNIVGYKACFVRLVDYNSQQTKETAFLSGGDRHMALKENFEKIPGMPVAYWVSDAMLGVFENGKCLENIASIVTGISTGNNDKYLRNWHEVSNCNLALCYDNIDDVNLSINYWIPYNKGGEARKWYGNNDYVVKWSESEKFHRPRPTFKELYLKQGLTWSFVTTGMFSTRFYPNGFLWDVAGSPCVIRDKMLLNYVLGYLSTKIAHNILKIINPTINCQVVDIQRIPIIVADRCKSHINELVTQNITISKTDWDSFETSWDFQRHPLVKGIYKRTKIFENTFGDYMIEGSFKEWERETNERLSTLKANEVELNRIFIEMYDLQDELTPEVEDKDVTIRKADLQRDIKSFISYAVGCMFGRYSLDMDGLIYAGGVWDKDIYKTFIPDENNILPITDNDYFDDDIVARFVEFVKVVYGEEWLPNNLHFIAETLYPNANGTEREKIRRYFLNDFYKDHVKTYQKKPIYWQFDSGKQGGFKCLIYLHRYDKYTAARVRTDYLHVLQRKYEAEIKRLDMLSGMTENPREKAEYKKQIQKIEKQLTECRAYDPALAHIAHQTIELDLDDGVTVNYGKFMGVEVGGDRAVDLLTKI